MSGVSSLQKVSTTGIPCLWQSSTKDVPCVQCSAADLVAHELTSFDSLRCCGFPSDLHNELLLFCDEETIWLHIEFLLPVVG